MKLHEADADDAQRVTLACHARVSWFDVRQLSATALMTLSSTIIGSMSGRRELMAALEPHAQAHFDLAQKDSVWIDYIADCGDGWNASHSVAWLAGRDALLLADDGTPTAQMPSADCRKEVELHEAPGHVLLPAGEALILGGDEVYPTASSRGYKERLEGPMRSARFFQPGGREVYAIPGNHDWYDGLTSFIRLFCQTTAFRRWLGAWQTRQRRSYFALGLPHGWWLWGLDLALEDDLDPPQYDYFHAQANKLKPGDQLILAAPTPIWLALRQGSDDASKRLDKLEMVMKLALDRGAAIPLIVTGDSHFYAHHVGRSDGKKRDYVVCGGGGAFTLGTGQVPSHFTTADGGDANEQTLFPTREESRRLRRGLYSFPFLNATFSATLAAIQLIALWLLQFRELSSGGAVGFGTFACGILVALGHSPGAIIWLLLLTAGFCAFGVSGARGDKSSFVAGAIGLIHGLIQSIAALALLWVALQLGHGHGGLIRCATYGAALPVAGLALGWLFALYLALTHWIAGMHNLEVYSAQALESWKCFLRIRIDRTGATVYPIGLLRSARRWVPAPDVRREKTSRGALVTRLTLLVPKGCLRIMDPATPLEPHLIEPAFTCGKVTTP